MRVALIGYGRMGHMVEACIEESHDMELAGIVDLDRLSSLREVEAPDVAVDFSYPGDLQDLLDAALGRRIPLVIGRTGLQDAEEEMIRATAREIPIVRANNFSLGVTVMRHVVRQVADTLGNAFDVEIVETHHRRKLDAPSGTVKMLLSAIDPEGRRQVVHGREGVVEKQDGEIGVHVLRGGTVCGEHSVHFYGDMEELTVAHRADSRRVFAVGALRAAAFVVRQRPGLYGMEQVLFGENAL